MLTPKTIKIAKFVVTVISAGLTLASKTSNEKLMDAKIAKKVAEELSKHSM